MQPGYDPAVGVAARERANIRRPLQNPAASTHRLTYALDRILVPVVDLLVLTISWAILAPIGLIGAACVILSALGLSTTLHRGRIHPRLADDIGPVLARLALPFVLIGPWLAGRPELTRILRAAPLVLVLVLLGRACSYGILNRTRAKGKLTEPTVIVGAGKQAVLLANTLREHPEYGLIPVGFLDRVDDVDLPLPLLGDAGDLEWVIDCFSIRRVIVAFGIERDPAMVRVLRACGAAQVHVHVLPRFFELGIGTADRSTDDIWGIPLLPVRRAALRPGSQRLRRALDLVVASIGLLVTGPLLLAGAIAVRLSSPGPILFRQKRVGQHERIVEVLKFRTMRVNDDSDTHWAADGEGDTRVTRLGAILRRTSIDELPQLINVLRGDMSMVGPRPERPFFVDRFSADVVNYQDRHRVPVGLTGWSQIHGLRGDSSIEDRARFDNQYIENWSLWRDVLILLRTAGTVVRDTIRFPRVRRTRSTSLTRELPPADALSARLPNPSSPTRQPPAPSSSPGHVP